MLSSLKLKPFADLYWISLLRWGIMRYLLPFLQASRKVGPVRDERKQLTNPRQRCKKAFSNCYAYLGLLLQSDCNKMPYESVNLLFDLSGMFFSSSAFDKVVVIVGNTEIWNVLWSGYLEANRFSAKCWCHVRYLCIAATTRTFSAISLEQSLCNKCA